MAITNAFNFPDKIREQVAGVIQAGWPWGNNAPVQAPNIHGPALVYTGWNGASCGKSHSFTAIAEAAERLGIPVYVIDGNALTDTGQPLAQDRPGIRIEPKNTDDLAQILGNYNLFFEDRHVHFVGADGKVTGARDVVSANGADAIVAAFSPDVAREKSKLLSTPPDRGGNGR